MAASAFGCAAEAPPHGMVIDPPQEAPVVRIADAAGVTFDLDKERGQRSVLLFFGYTHCPDICPATLADWVRVKQALGNVAGDTRFVFVSVDPDRDTPAVVRDYVRQFDSTFVGLAPTVAQLDTLKAAWGFDVMRDSMPGMKKGAYAVTHPAGTFAIDRAGRIREIFSPNTRPDDIASDLRRVR